MVEKTERPPRTSDLNVEAKWGSFQMENISHHRRRKFSRSTLESGGAGGEDLTPRFSTTPEHTPPSPEVVRNILHLPTRCGLSSRTSVPRAQWCALSKVGRRTSKRILLLEGVLEVLSRCFRGASLRLSPWPSAYRKPVRK